MTKIQRLILALITTLLPNFASADLNPGPLPIHPIETVIEDTQNTRVIKVADALAIECVEKKNQATQYKNTLVASIAYAIKNPPVTTFETYSNMVLKCARYSNPELCRNEFLPIKCDDYNNGNLAATHLTLHRLVQSQRQSTPWQWFQPDRNHMDLICTEVASLINSDQLVRQVSRQTIPEFDKDPQYEDKVEAFKKTCLF